MEDSNKIVSFEQLKVWQTAQEWAVLIYKVTKTFPNDEVYGMTSQLRRAVSSVSANIAEGFGRRTKNDKLHFYTMAYGSALETKNFIYLAQKLGYIDKVQLKIIIDSGTSVQRLLNAFMRPLKNA